MFYARIAKEGIERAVHNMWNELQLGVHRVFPVSKETSKLYANVANGDREHEEELDGETKIAEFVNSPRYDPLHHTIKHLFVAPIIPAWPELCEAITAADYIVLGPGSYFTSTMAVLLANGICEAIRHSRAKVIFIPNLMQVEWESKGFGVEQYLAWIEQESFIGRPVDVILFSHDDRQIPLWIRRSYASQGKHPVMPTDALLMHSDHFLKYPMRGSTKEGIIVHDPKLLAIAFAGAFKKFPPKD